MRTLLTILVAVFALPPAAPPPRRIVALVDGTRIEAEAVRRGDRIVLKTAFGERTVDPAEIQGDAEIPLEKVESRFQADLAQVGERDQAALHRLGRWCETQGYLTGLREVLNRALRLDVEDPWARERCRTLALAYRVHATDGSDRNRDQRDFVDHLFSVLARDDNVGAVMAMEKARGLPRELVLRPALRALDDDRTRTRWMAASLLAGFEGSPERIKPLYRRGLQDGAMPVRREAVRALKATGDPAFVRLYAKELSNPKDLVRVRAAEALGELGDRQAVGPLVAALEDTWRVNRSFAAFTTQQAYVKDYDVEVAQTAFIADPIVDVIQDGSMIEVGLISVNVERRILREALRRIVKADLGDSPKSWRKWLESKEGSDGRSGGEGNGG